MRVPISSNEINESTHAHVRKDFTSAPVSVISVMALEIRNGMNKCLGALERNGARPVRASRLGLSTYLGVGFYFIATRMRSVVSGPCAINSVFVAFGTRY